MKIKAVHFDMKAMCPTAEYALTLVDELSAQGINAILAEFEDMFPFEVTKGTHHPCAWSKEEFRRFALRCRERNVEVIPLVQSIGHLDYLLKYPKFRALRDGGPGGSTYQWCLALEDSYDLWCRMVDEVMEVFPESTFFHIGADECRMNIPCERCGENKLDHYISRTARCCKYIQSKNLKAIIWDDVLRKYGEDKYALLPPGVISCIWFYGALDYDYLDRMAASGIECWGASCIQSHRFFHAISPQAPKMRNVDAWGKIHEKYPQFSGHVGTVWGRNQCQSPFNSNLPQALFMTAYLAETLEKGCIKEREKFMNEFGRNFFGMELDYSTMISSFGYEPGCAEPLVTELKEKAPLHRDIAEIWYGLNAVDQLLFFIYSCFSHNDCQLETYRAGMAPREMTAGWLDNVRRCQEDTSRGLAELRPLMIKYFRAEMWDEFIEQRFKSKFEQNEYWRHVISSAALKWEENLKRPVTE